MINNQCKRQINILSITLELKKFQLVIFAEIIFYCMKNFKQNNKG
jgi:hypothetical protein